jgi:hypothetical protein
VTQPSPSQEQSAKTSTPSITREDESAGALVPPAAPTINTGAREAIKDGASPEEAMVNAQAAGESAGASTPAAAAGANNAVSLALIDGTLPHGVVEGETAYKAPPKEMRWKDSADIELVLRPSTAKSITELKQEIDEKLGKADEIKEVAPISVSKQMKATLDSKEDNFGISSMTGESEQAITSDSVTTWKWTVVASNRGEDDLFLNLRIGLSTPQGESLGSRPVEGFPVGFEKISVKGTGLQSVADFIGSNWQWLWTAILIPIVAFLWGRRKQSNKNGDKRFIGSSWQWLRTTIIVPVASFLQERRKQSNKNRDGE